MFFLIIFYLIFIYSFINNFFLMFLIIEFSSLILIMNFVSHFFYILFYLSTNCKQQLLDKGLCLRRSKPSGSTS